VRVYCQPRILQDRSSPSRAQRYAQARSGKNVQEAKENGRPYGEATEAKHGVTKRWEHARCDLKRYHKALGACALRFRKVNRTAVRLGKGSYGPHKMHRTWYNS
jgi:hypothetical protein